eukprot:2623332-Pyramimonas_sp.AAC.1
MGTTHITNNQQRYVPFRAARAREGRALQSNVGFVIGFRTSHFGSIKLFVQALVGHWVDAL